MHSDSRPPRLEASIALDLEAMTPANTMNDPKDLGGDVPVLLRLPADIKNGLARLATLHGRKMAAEINIRLRESLRMEMEGGRPLLDPGPRAPGPWDPGSQLQTLDDKHDGDVSLLELWNALSTEKKLAILTLMR
jgi:hypothetical protein